MIEEHDSLARHGACVRDTADAQALLEVCLANGNPSNIRAARKHYSTMLEQQAAAALLLRTDSHGRKRMAAHHQPTRGTESLDDD